MKIFFIFLPAIIVATGLFMHRLSGRKELLKMDLVQFIYAFILTPTVLIWLKIVVFFNVCSELNITDVEDKFFIDTAITTIFLFIYAFVVIHSLTKTFAMKKSKDPLFDILEHSEYFHLWLSHIVTYSSALLLLFIPGFLNVFFPFRLLVNKSNLNISILMGIIFSAAFYYALWTYKVAEQHKFDRVMKLQVYIYTFILLTTYLISRPKYSPQYIIFWCSVIFFVISTISTQFLRRKQIKTTKSKK